MADITFSTGIVEMSVNGVRNIRFNPSDVGFMETLYGLMAKVEEIDTESRKKREKADEPAKVFDYFRSSDKRMREAVDAVFGDGFCDDVFDGVRLMALADGLTVLENFIFAVIDNMDESVRDNMAQRDSKIAKYTAKYQNRKK